MNRFIWIAAAALLSAPVPGRCERAPQQTAEKSAYRIEIDYSQTPDLKDWVERELRPALAKWYPRIIALLPSDGYSAPRQFSVTIEANGDGVAATSGDRVTANAKWIRQELARGPQNEAAGALIHEAAHVVQRYEHDTPGWLVEGIADYIRWWKFEPASARTRVRAFHRDGKPASYTDAYRTTAAFLEFVAEHYDHEIVVELNAAARRGVYTADTWRDATGKSVDALWTEYAATLKP